MTTQAEKQYQAALELLAHAVKNLGGSLEITAAQIEEGVQGQLAVDATTDGSWIVRLEP